MTTGSDALIVRCERCGGGFGFAGQPGGLVCPYCGQRQMPSPEFVARLQHYHANVQGEIARANAAYGRAAVWEGWAEYGQRTRPQLKVIIPIASGVTLLATLALAASQKLGISPAVVGPVFSTIIVAMSTLLIGYVLFQSIPRGAKGRRAAPGVVAVSCPSCGAPGQIVAGAPAQTCAYCHSTLVASAPVMQRGTDAAALAHRQARLEEVRQERAGMASFAAYDMSAYVPYFTLGPLALMLGSGSVAFTIQMLDGSEPYSPAIFAIWGMFLTCSALLLGVLLWRRARRSAFARALGDLAHQFRLARLGDTLQVVSWLNRFWPERYEGTQKYLGHDFVAAALDAWGYPALLICDVTRGEDRTPWLHLLLAAVRPPHAPPEARSAPGAALARCRELGFEVSLTEAGLVGRASPETVELVRKSPAALRAVAPALAAMAHAAHALGGVPAS